MTGETRNAIHKRKYTHTLQAEKESILETWEQNNIKIV
jgi:hypothetical protein